MDSIVRWFDPYGDLPPATYAAQAGKHGKNKSFWVLFQFLSLWAGVFAKWIVDENGKSPKWLSNRSLFALFVAFAVSTTIFPATFKQLRTDHRQPKFLQLVILFGAGFGYKAVTDIRV